jgi:hypothetical protein
MFIVGWNVVSKTVCQESLFLQPFSFRRRFSPWQIYHLAPTKRDGGTISGDEDYVLKCAYKKEDHF